MSLGLASQLVLLGYRKILSSWEHYFYKSWLSIEMDMDMFWLPECHTSVDQQLYALLFMYCIVKSAEKKNLKALLFVRSEVELHLLGCTGTWDLILRPVEHQAHSQLCELWSINGPRCGGMLCWNVLFPKPLNNDSIFQMSKSNGTMLLCKQLA